jgi:hypothetical protein
MTAVRMTITRMVDESFPGWVECELVDADGRTWKFEEKIPVVSAEQIWTDSQFPIETTVDCTVVGKRADPVGRHVVSIDLARPWGIESLEGNSRFEVLCEQINEDQ